MYITHLSENKIKDMTELKTETNVAKLSKSESNIELGPLIWRAILVFLLMSFFKTL